MTVGKLAEQLRGFDPKATVVTGTFTDNSEILFALRSDKFPEIVVLECKSDIYVANEINARYDDLYAGLHEVGFTVSDVRDAMGNYAAELYRRWIYERD